MVRETLAKGGRAYRPRIAHPTLAAAFVDPALAYLKRKGAQIRLGQRLRGLIFGPARRSRRWNLPRRPCRLARDDAVVLAVPPWVAKELVPGLTAPDDFRAIVNAHFQHCAARRARRRCWA